MSKPPKQTIGRIRKAPPVTLMPTAWDAGAAGPANRAGLREEPASDFDMETGRETRNPNGIRRHRRSTWVTIYSTGSNPRLSHAQAAAADRLFRASLGMPERDPIAAIGEVRGGSGDPQAAAVDRRREFIGMWARIPTSSRPVIERVVLDDQPVWDGNSAQRERHMQRLRIGLDAIA